MEYPYTFEDVLKKFGETPKCYLTGIEIDLSKPSTYSLDHIIPLSKGGDNSLENMGLCIRIANQAKHDLSYDAFISLCKNIVSFAIKKEETGTEPVAIN